LIKIDGKNLLKESLYNNFKEIKMRKRVRKILEIQKINRMNGDKPGSGPNGKCICPKCGFEEKHARGVPCNKKNCPECGTRMTRE
jgi:rubrerythrin